MIYGSKYMCIYSYSTFANLYNCSNMYNHFNLNIVGRSKILKYITSFHNTSFIDGEVLCGAKFLRCIMFEISQIGLELRKLSS